MKNQEKALGEFVAVRKSIVDVKNELMKVDKKRDSDQKVTEGNIALVKKMINDANDE